MDDLDTLLQDFSYLKSLEYKDRLPPKVEKKLLLPDRSCVHAVNLRFKRTNEVVFKRMFKRPVARRCFETFLESPGRRRLDPVAAKLVEFLKAVDAIGKPPERGSKPVRRRSTLRRRSSLEPQHHAGSLHEVSEVYQNFMNDPVLTSHETLWTNPALKIYYEESFAMLETIARRQAENRDGDAPSEMGGSPKRRTSIQTVQISIMGMFTPFENEAKAYLAGEPWQAFLESDVFTRYAQWKQLELNMKVNEQDFDIHRILGRGGFGEVYGCRKRDTGAMFAMKQLDKKRLKKEGQEMSVIHERNVLAEMTSKFVTNLKYAFHDKDTLYLVMDLMEGGDLAFHLAQCEKGRFTEAQARFYGAEISLGLAHLHSHSFIYRDLKPANVLLSSSGHARISDMGLVRNCSKTWPTAQCGTHGYMAPEVLLDNTSYGLAVDWFSFGCTIYELLVGVTPFYGKSKRGKRPTAGELDDRTKAGVVSYPSFLSTKARSCLEGLLEVDPTTRLGGMPDGSSDWFSVQHHEWFCSIDWEALSEWKVEALIIPRHGQVNAKEVYEIGSDKHAREARRIKITDEDNRKFYRHFDHVMSHQWQEEVLPMFNMITKAGDKADEKRSRAIKATSNKAQGVPKGAILMEGYMMKRAGPRFWRGWSKRYVHILSDRIEWRDEAERVPKRVIRFKDSEFTINAGEKPGEPKQLVLTVPAEQLVFTFKALYPSDENIWCRTLNEACFKITGKLSLSDASIAGLASGTPDAVEERLLAASTASDAPLAPVLPDEPVPGNKTSPPIDNSDDLGSEPAPSSKRKLRVSKGSFYHGQTPGRDHHLDETRVLSGPSENVFRLTDDLFTLIPSRDAFGPIPSHASMSGEGGPVGLPPSEPSSRRPSTRSSISSLSGNDAVVLSSMSMI